MAVITQVARYAGMPYFLIEDPVGFFGAMKLFYINPDRDNSIDFVVDKTQFELDRDIVEVNVGGQAICLEHPLEADCYEITRRVISELRQFATNCNKQFVSYVPFQRNFGAYVGRRNDMFVMRLEPRLFVLSN